MNWEEIEHFEWTGAKVCSVCGSQKFYLENRIGAPGNAALSCQSCGERYLLAQIIDLPTAQQYEKSK